MVVSRMSWGTAPSSQQIPSSSWRGSRGAGFPHFITSGGMPSLPGTFPFESVSMALLSSSMVG